MSEERTVLLEQANELGLDFHSNIPTPKLIALIAEAKGEPPAVDEIAPASPKENPGATDPEEQDSESEVASEAKEKVLSKYAAKRLRIAEAKGKAFKTRVVTITNKDNRENDIMTTVYLSFENQHFGLSKVVPLDVPVELENALIQIAASTVMTLHKDEIVDGRRTGNKVPMRVKKFAISYGKQPDA